MRTCTATGVPVDSGRAGIAMGAVETSIYELLACCGLYRVFVKRKKAILLQCIGEEGRRIYYAVIDDDALGVLTPRSATSEGATSKQGYGAKKDTADDDLRLKSWTGGSRSQSTSQWNGIGFMPASSDRPSRRGSTSVSYVCWLRNAILSAFWKTP